MLVLVTGASGFAGSLLIPRLQRQGHRVRALAREENRARQALEAAGGDVRDLELLRGDALRARSLAPALDGVEVAYYLIHSMERLADDRQHFAVRECLAAENFASAAAAAGVRRIVYLGGLLPHEHGAAGAQGAGVEERVSAHLASRLHVEQVLLDAVADSIALRASIVIGARSRSFRLLVRLVERLPVLALPAWQRFRTEPIDARDVIAMLAACATAAPPRRRLEIGGPEILSYAEILGGIADAMLVNRPALKLGVNLTPLTARLAAAIASEDPALVVPLMEGLRGDLLTVEHDAPALLGVRLHSFDAAVERALADWERVEQLAAR
jgi:uncharacterized protein YbjT (DUF2867 family)